MRIKFTPYRAFWLCNFWDDWAIVEWKKVNKYTRTIGWIMDGFYQIQGVLSILFILLGCRERSLNISRYVFSGQDNKTSFMQLDF